MNKIFLLLFTFACIPSFSQIININDAGDAESTDTLQSLIENVFISGDCAVVNSFTEKVHGISTDRMGKSYGYFSRPAGSDFPFANGVVLSSGKAFDGGNTTTSVTAAEEFMTAGDADLETALSMTNTNDATYIKFNFQSVTSSISFRFIMASEEYGGNVECNYWDGFAFLLREAGTTTYTNLAVLPDGTPVSVKNINNSNNCADNVAFFEGYNLTDTNYGGRTKILTAQANVIPNQLYEMKIVMADQGDYTLDSAVFLEGGSFNLGADLGGSHLSTDNTAICGTEKLLELNIPAISYTWFYDNVLVPGEISASYNANLGDGIYKVQATISAGCIAESEVELQFVTPATITPSSDIPKLYTCFNGDDTNTFDLTERDSDILGTQSNTEFEVLYFTEATATLVSQINTPTAFDSSGQTIYAQVQNITSTNCTSPVVANFDIAIAVTDAADPEDIPKMEYCDNDDDGNAFNGVVAFNLLYRKDVILNGSDETDYTLSFFTDDAYSVQIPAANITSFMNTSELQIIYVQMTNNSDTACFDRTSFEIEVYPIPVVTYELDFNLCDEDSDSTNDTLMNLTNVNSHISNNYENESFLYFESLAAAESGTPVISNPENYMGSDGDTIWIRTITNHSCFVISQINIKVTITNTGAYTKIIALCDDFIEGSSSDQDGISEFDLTQVSEDILNLYPVSIRSDLNITFYPAPFTNVQLQTNMIKTPSKYRNVTDNTLNTPERIFIKIENKNNLDCAGMGIDLYIDLIVNNTPYFELENQIMCTGDLPKPLQIVNPTGTYDYVWKDSNGNVLVTDIDSTEIVFIPNEGEYTVTATDTSTSFNCSKTIAFNVQLSSSAIIKTFTIFDNLQNNRIAIVVEGLGDYVYAIDGDSFNKGNSDDGHVFNNVTEGLHQIHIKDLKNDCVTTHREVVVLRFPKHITPNHDGKYDTFSVYGGDYLQVVRLTIFDKNGKVLALLNNNDTWDGTYLGEIAPKSDYWFRVDFVDKQGIVRTRKGYFSLVN